MPTSVLTTDITRDTPNNDQVRFVPEPPTILKDTSSPPATTAARDYDYNGLPLSVGWTNPISAETAQKAARSSSESPNRSPAREFTVSEQSKSVLAERSMIIF